MWLALSIGTDLVEPGLGGFVHHGAGLRTVSFFACAFMPIPTSSEAMEGGLVMWQVGHLREFFRRGPQRCTFSDKDAVCCKTEA